MPGKLNAYPDCDTNPSDPRCYHQSRDETGSGGNNRPPETGSGTNNMPNPADLFAHNPDMLLRRTSEGWQQLTPAEATVLNDAYVQRFGAAPLTDPAEIERAAAFYERESLAMARMWALNLALQLDQGEAESRRAMALGEAFQQYGYQRAAFQVFQSITERGDRNFTRLASIRTNQTLGAIVRGADGQRRMRNSNRLRGRTS